MELADYNNEFGDIDLFLLDLLLKGHVKNGADVLDAGCGAGRNTFFFLKQGFHVKAIDRIQSEVVATNFMSRTLNGSEVALHGHLDNLPYVDQSFDLIVSSRVLHFSESKAHFDKVMSEFFRVLRPTGILYLSMNSKISSEGNSENTNHFLLTPSLTKEIMNCWTAILSNRTVLFEGGHGETTLVLKKKR